MGQKSAKLFAAILLLCCGLDWRADAQNYVQQSGAITAGHVPYWLYNGILADGGPATNGNLTELGITANGGLPFCIQNTKVHTGPYVQLCLGTSATTGYLSLAGFGGATPALNFIIDGTVYPFPVQNVVLGPGASTVGDVAIWNNTSGTLLKDVDPNTFIATTLGGSTGNILYFNGTRWIPLANGTPGNVLQTNGSSAPVWVPQTSGGNVNGPGSATVGNIAIFNNGAGTLLAQITASALLDSNFGSAPGDVLCRSGGGWVVLAPGSSGQFLTSNGAGSCPQWSSSTPPATGLRTVATGTTDTITSADANSTVAWNSGTSSPKSETLTACISGLNGMTVSVKDEIGTAGTYPITVTSSSNIDGSTTYIMAFNFQSITFQCDGTSTNWILK